MRGEFIGVWSMLWQEVWIPLFDQEGVSGDIYCELYRELEPALRKPKGEDARNLVINDSVQMREAFDRALIFASVQVDLIRRNAAFDALPTGLSNSKRRSVVEGALASFIYDQEEAKRLLLRAIDELTSNSQKHQEAWERRIEIIINDKDASKEVFQNTKASDLQGERSIIAFLEACHATLDDFGGDNLSNSYFNLLSAFIEKFSLRYDLRRPCQLCPTLPGVFTSLIRDLKEATRQDAHLNSLMQDFEISIRDLRTDCSDSRIRTCMTRQVNLLEAFGSRFPGVNATTVGAICNAVGTWPHESVKDAMKNLYKFTCDYPGIRHAGTPSSAIRPIDMRDMIAMSILLAGFMPYLTDQLNVDAVYRGT